MDAFWNKAEKTDSCWNWTAYCARNGYGRFGDFYAHRVAYTLAVGPIPDGLSIDHLCGNRRCVNPAHLEAVTLGENNLRGNSPAAINRRKTHCNRGHALSGENVYIYRGSRRCRACCRAQDANRPSGWERQRQKRARASSPQFGEVR